MQFPIVREHKTDLTNSNLENEKRGEPFKVQVGVFSRIIVPRHSPFFVESLVMYFPNGKPMEYDVDYRIYKLMPRLTDLTAKKIACMIELIKPEITEGKMDYDVVGEFTLFDSTMMNIIAGAVDDDRPIWWENIRNKPTAFPPKWHQHSVLYDVVAWQDFIEVIDMIAKAVVDHGRPLIQVKIDHYFDVFIHRLGIYKTMMTDYMKAHFDTYDEHGLTALQVGLEKVDNFATAIGAQALEQRRDLHLTVQGLQTIIDKFGFDTSEFLAANSIPISQFGNTNFIPPNLDGSFEGFGGIVETAGMCLEGDGSITYLWNRMDGRTSGLYYSSMTDSNDPDKCKLTYTGFKYEHPRFKVDGANVDRIAQGSGGECILVGDSARNLWYIGVTNGSLDPAKHVYSRINLQPICDATIGGSPINLFPEISVAMMGDWIYIIQSYGVPKIYKQFWRVRIVDVQATVPVTPGRQNVSYTNADGSVFGATATFVWYGGGLFNFSPLYPNGMTGLYRSLPTIIAEDPARKGTYALKFLAGYYAAYSSASINTSVTYTPEINYDFNPYTGVMTLTSKSILPPSVDMRQPKPIPDEYRQNLMMYYSVFFFQGQGINVLDDGRVIISGAYGFSGFPRAGLVWDMTNSNTRHATVRKLWGTGNQSITRGVMYAETITSPIMSSVNVRAMMYRPEGEYYVAANRSILDKLELFWKEIRGKFAVRSEVTNLFVGPVVSRPLTTNVRKVNASPAIGAATVVVPSSQLDTYGIDVGEGAFCMGSQKKYAPYNLEPGHYNPTNVGDDDILLIAAHNRVIESDGTVTLAPTIEIIYPAAIVSQLINQVQNVAIARRGTACIVTVADPTFSSMERFGWLPVTVGITYIDAPGANADSMYATYMVIQPTYVTNAQGRKEVTGFSVTDIFHWGALSAAVGNGIRVFHGKQGDTPQTTLGPMRMHYYLNGAALSCYFNSGVIGSTIGDAYTSNFSFSYNNRNTRRWSGASQVGNSSPGYGTFTTPDNGITVQYPMASVSGGAATIVQGSVNRPLVGSVYPEVGWIIFFKTDIIVTFAGKQYVLPLGAIDLRDIDPNPANKTFYIYARLDGGIPRYEVSLDKRLESVYQLWVGRAITNDRQILTLERFNVVTLNGNRVSETKRGGCIPATSGLINAEGQIPWLRHDELLP